MLNKQQVIDLIRLNKAPFWIVKSKGSQYGGTMTNKGAYQLTDNNKKSDSENANEFAELVPDSIKRFEELCTFLQHETPYCFEITLKRYPKESGASNSVTTHEFRLNDGQQNQALNGMGNSIAGGNLVTIEYAQALAGIEAQKVEVRLSALKKEMELSMREQVLQQKEKDLNQRAEYFDRDTNKLGAAIYKVADVLLSAWVKDTPSLSGVKVDYTEAAKNDAPETQDNRSQIVEEIADNIYSNIESVEELQGFKAAIDNIIHNYKSSKTNSNGVSESTQEKTDNN